MRIHMLAAVAGAALLGLSGCGGSDPVAPQAAPSPSASASASASVSPSASSKAVDAGTGSKPVTAVKTPATKKTSRDDGCPVKPATLARVAHLPAGYRIDGSSLKCSQGWAVAGLIAPSPDMQGDGVLLFKYAESSRTWKKKGEGSALECADFGIPESTGFCDTRH